MGKVLVIGLDGATWDLIKPWAKEGELPTIYKLMESGIHGDLCSTIHPVSPQAWSSFLTGKNPGKHGIFGFTERVEGKYLWTPINSKYRKSANLWNILTDHNMCTGSFFVPITFPPEKLNGLMISGLGTPGVESNFTYPPNLKSELIAKFGKNYILEGGMHKNLLEYLQYLLKSIEYQKNIVGYLTSKNTFDLTLVVFGQSDRVQHFFWKQMTTLLYDTDSKESREVKNAIFSVYQKLDEAIAQLLLNVDRNTTVIIMSDHGAGPYFKSIYLNNWFGELGLLTLKDNKQYDNTSVSEYIKRFLKSSLIFIKNNIPSKLHHTIKVITPLSLWVMLKSISDSYSWASKIDWARTRVYTDEGYYGNIYLNLKEREPFGIVEPGKESEDLLDEFTKRLYQLSDPETGEQVVGAVYRRDDLYSGPFSYKSPDLVVQCKGYLYHIKPGFEENNNVFTPAGKFGNIELEHSAIHRMNGILIAVGNEIKSGYELIGANIMDIAPTILHILGLPIPKDIDGHVLKEIFKENSELAKREVVYQDVSEKEMIKERIKELKGLGKT